MLNNVFLIKKEPPSKLRTAPSLWRCLNYSNAAIRAANSWVMNVNRSRFSSNVYTHCLFYFTRMCTTLDTHAPTNFFLHIQNHIDNTGLCDGLHDGDACTFGNTQPCASAGSLPCCVYCTGHHCWQMVSTSLCISVLHMSLHQLLISVCWYACITSIHILRSELVMRASILHHLDTCTHAHTWAYTHTHTHMYILQMDASTCHRHNSSTQSVKK